MSEGSSNLCNEPGKKSVRMNEKDVKKAERLGYADTSASTIFSDLLDDAIKLQVIQDKKKQEHREKRQELQDEAELYGIE